MLDEFHQFPYLPMELRLKIWNFHLRIPRKVEIREADGQGEGVLKGGPHPVLLSVNQESRRESENHYGLFFKQTLYMYRHNRGFTFNDWYAGTYIGIYLNPAFDSILVDKWNTENCFSWHDLKHFERIVATGLCALNHEHKVVLPIYRFLDKWDYGYGYNECGQPPPHRVSSMRIIMPTVSTDPDIPFDGTTVFIPKYRHSRQDEKLCAAHPDITVVREETGPILAFRPRYSGEETMNNWQFTGLKIYGGGES